jgi:hypothetical protein
MIRRTLQFNAGRNSECFGAHPDNHGRRPVALNTSVQAPSPGRHKSRSVLRGRPDDELSHIDFQRLLDREGDRPAIASGVFGRSPRNDRSAAETSAQRGANSGFSTL